MKRFDRINPKLEPAADPLRSHMDPLQARVRARRPRGGRFGRGVMRPFSDATSVLGGAIPDASAVSVAILALGQMLAEADVARARTFVRRDRG